MRERKISKELKEFYDQVKENPIISHRTIEPDPKDLKTTQKHVSELHDILVQTCIDYINKYGLMDIYSVTFNADSLAESAKCGSWQPCTDSYIRVDGLKKVIYTRKDGSEFDGFEDYMIGDEL